MRGERERERESGLFKRGARGALDGRAANSSDAAGSGVAGVAWAAADVAGEGLRRQRGRGIWSITNSGCGLGRRWRAVFAGVGRLVVCGVRRGKGEGGGHMGRNVMAVLAHRMRWQAQFLGRGRAREAVARPGAALKTERMFSQKTMSERLDEQRTVADVAEYVPWNCTCK